jgi:hypothetical protein
MITELIEQASSEIAEYSATELGLADLRARMKDVEYCVTTTAGMAVAKADRAEVRGLRTGLEAMRKQIKAPALAHAKLIDEEAKRITAELMELEEPIDAQIKAEEVRKENEKAAREAAERARITDIHRRIADIRAFQGLASVCRTSAAIQVLIDKLANVEMVGLDEFEDEAKITRIDTMHAMEALHGIRVTEEADRAEMIKVRAELAAAKAALDAINKVAKDAAIAQADKLATERQALLDEQTKVKAEQELEAYKAAVEPAERATPAIEVVAASVPFSSTPIEPLKPLILPTEITDTLAVRTPPSGRELIETIAEHYAVSNRTAAEWLDAADFTPYY